MEEIERRRQTSSCQTLQGGRAVVVCRSVRTHERTGHRPTHSRGVESIVLEPLSYVLLNNACSVGWGGVR